MLCKVFQGYDKLSPPALIEALNLLADAINVWKRDFIEGTRQTAPAVLQVAEHLASHEDPSIKEAAQRVFREYNKYRDGM